MTTAPPAAPDPTRIVVVGASYRDSSTDVRQGALARLPDLFDRLDERIVLNTCHRVEVIGVGHVAGVASGPLRVRRGRDAVERVLTVVAGLDSAIVAEEQLLAQVREAYRTAQANDETGPILNELMRRALHVGRRARSMTGPSVDRSLADRALAAIGAPATALLVGSGAMAEQLAAGLRRRRTRLTIASRTPERATALAARLGAQAVAWDELLLDGHWDLVAFATRVSDPLLSTERADALHPAAVIDLCAPAAVAPDARPRLGPRLIDLDTLGAAPASTLSARSRRRLEALIAEEADRYLAWLAELPAFDAVSRLHARAAELRDRYLGRLRQSDRFDEAQLAVVDRMTAQLVGELLHEPTLRLRAGERP